MDEEIIPHELESYFSSFVVTAVILILTLFAAHTIHLWNRSRRSREKVNFSQVSQRLLEFLDAASAGDVPKLTHYLTEHVRTPINKLGGREIHHKCRAIDINARNRGNSALRCAIQANGLKSVTQEHIKCVQLLLAHGADISETGYISSYYQRTGIAHLVWFIYKQQSFNMWYALEITQLAIAAGYQFDDREIHTILDLFMKTVATLCKKDQPTGQSWSADIDMYSEDSLLWNPQLPLLLTGEIKTLSNWTPQVVDSNSLPERQPRTLQHQLRLHIRGKLSEGQWKNTNLFFTVQQLSLPPLLKRYLLYGLDMPPLEYTLKS